MAKDRRSVGRFPLEIIAIANVILAEIFNWRASEFEVYRTLAHYIVAHILTGFDDAFGNGLVVSPCKVCGARDLCVASAVQCRTHPALVRD
jgi:hypothetical protein